MCSTFVIRYKDCTTLLSEQLDIYLTCHAPVTTAVTREGSSSNVH